MAADRRVDAGPVALLAHQRLVQPLAHAVQALELEVAAVAGPFEEGGDGQRIVGGEGGVDVARAQHVARAGEVADVGRRLAREQRIVGEPLFLRALEDRKSTRLNSSHANISYAVFCLKKTTALGAWLLAYGLSGGLPWHFAAIALALVLYGTSMAAMIGRSSWRCGRGPSDLAARTVRPPGDGFGMRVGTRAMKMPPRLSSEGALGSRW